MNNNRLFFRSAPIVLLFFMLLCLWSTKQAKAQENPSVLLDEDLLSLMEKGNIPGLSAVVIDGKRKEVRTLGYQNKSTLTPVTPHTLFEMASCSKAFTALAVYRFAALNGVDLDAAIQTFLTDFKLYYEGQEQEVTIRQLLQHTSGIPWNTIARIPASDAATALEQTIQSINGINLDSQPGTHYSYATINYDLLAFLLQTISGKPFENCLEELVFTPLHLQYTSVGTPYDSVWMAKGYKIGFFTPQPYDAPRYKGNNAAAYVISNARDMQKWLEFQLGLTKNGLYSFAQKTHERDETVPLHGSASYASGWEVLLDGSGQIRHAGVNPNFTSFVLLNPQKHQAVAVMANANSPYTAIIANQLMQSLSGKVETVHLDPGDDNDKVFSFLTMAIWLYSLLVLVLFFRNTKGILVRKRKWDGFTKRKLWLITQSIVVLIPFIAGVYWLPEALAGFNWDAILVWTPISFYTLIVSLTAATILSYIAYWTALFFPEPDPYKRKIPQIVLISVLSGLSNVVVIVLVTSSIHAGGELKYWLFYYALALGLYLLGRRFVQVSLIKITRGLVYDLRTKLIDKIFSTSFQKFEKIERGRVYTAFNEDINTIGDSTNVFMLLITSVITAFGAFVYLASIAFWATLVTLGLIFTLAALYGFVSAKTNQYFLAARAESNVFMGLINGLIDGYKELSLSKHKKREFHRDVANSAQNYRNKLATADIKFVNAFLVGESLLVLLLGLVAFGMPEMFPSVQSFTIMSFVVVLLYLIGPINGILTSVPSLMQLKVAWDRLQGFIAEIPANLAPQKTNTSGATHVASLALKEVAFHYGQKEGQRPFGIGPINLSINSGEVIFMIGGNGSGKTTLAKLITGLYRPDSGTITLNNKKLLPEELSEYFSVVFSPSHLFQKMYKVDVANKKDQIEEYLSLLQLKDKVEVGASGYSTLELSSGQKKRLALMQCYLEDAPIYLFDEWAADQDPEYRNFFYRTLIPQMKQKGKIVIAITHDDHYFDVADRVYKMEDGQLRQFELGQSLHHDFA